MENLKRTLIAVPFALGLMGTASALPPTAIPDFEIFISGSSSSDNLIGGLFGQLCVDGTLDIYLDNSANRGSVKRAYFCTIDEKKIPNGLSIGTPDVLIHKRSAGGSAFGVKPVCEKQTSDGSEAPLDFLQINQFNCFLSVTGNYVCGEDLNQRHPDAGVSDVGPMEFVPSLASSQCDVVRSSFALVFGIVANERLRNALQNAQGLTVGSDSAADVPSLKTDKIRSMLVGNVGTWDKLTFGGAGLDTYATGLTENRVKICRRVPTSGAQTQAQLVLLDSGCTAGALGPFGAPGNPFGGPIVVENSGSGDVELCMQAAEDNGEMAIGIQSTEKNGDEEYAYRHIAIDGELPTINNAAKGEYSDWVVSTIQWEFPFVFPSNEDDIVAILQTVAARAASPDAMADANTNADSIHDWGQGGALALAENGCDPDAIFDINNPCTPYTRSPGGTPNNCTGPYLLEGQTSPSLQSGDPAKGARK